MTSEEVTTPVLKPENTRGFPRGPGRLRGPRLYRGAGYQRGNEIPRGTRFPRGSRFQRGVSFESGFPPRGSSFPRGSGIQRDISSQNGVSRGLGFSRGTGFFRGPRFPRGVRSGFRFPRGSQPPRGFPVTRPPLKVSPKPSRDSAVQTDETFLLPKEVSSVLTFQDSSSHNSEELESSVKALFKQHKDRKEKMFQNYPNPSCKPLDEEPEDIVGPEAATAHGARVNNEISVKFTPENKENKPQSHSGGYLQQQPTHLQQQPAPVQQGSLKRSTVPPPKVSTLSKDSKVSKESIVEKDSKVLKESIVLKESAVSKDSTVSKGSTVSQVSTQSFMPATIIKRGSSSIPYGPRKSLETYEPAKSDLPHVFMTIGVDSPSMFLGRVEIELRTDIAPQEAAFFLTMICSRTGPNYRNSIFHQLQPGILIQAGEESLTTTIDPINGKPPAKTIQKLTSETFPLTENRLKHDKAGVVSIVRSVQGFHGTQFVITLSRADFLNAKNVVVGSVVKGMATLDKVANQAKSKDKVKIFNCGTVVDGNNLRVIPLSFCNLSTCSGKCAGNCYVMVAGRKGGKKVIAEAEMENLPLMKGGLRGAVGGGEEKVKEVMEVNVAPGEGGNKPKKTKKQIRKEAWLRRRVECEKTV